jgi:cyclopropane fatty-acyl-phospholipid synthase-like methyltransferase
VPSEKNRRLFNSLAEQADPADFWGQVKRTVDGKPVGEEQIEMIVEAIASEIALASTDVVLDLCCANGALSDRIFARCRGGLGIDFAENLIAIARRNFEHPPERLFRTADVAEFARSTTEGARFTKALCYGSFQYLAPAAGLALLTALRERFPNLTRAFIGNLPDLGKMREFYYERAYVQGIERDHESPIGIWRTEAEFAALCAQAGWTAEFRRMPEGFYAAHYRYDAVLTRPQR